MIPKKRLLKSRRQRTDIFKTEVQGREKGETCGKAEKQVYKRNLRQSGIQLAFI